MNQAFIALLTYVVACKSTVSDHIKFLSLNKEAHLARPALIDLNLNEFHCYSYMVSLDRCNGTCNTIDDLLIGTGVLNKPKVVIFHVLNMIKGINNNKKNINKMYFM